MTIDVVTLKMQHFKAQTDDDPATTHAEVFPRAQWQRYQETPGHYLHLPAFPGFCRRATDHRS